MEFAFLLPMGYFLPKMLQTSPGNWYKLKKWDENFENILSFVSQAEY